MLNPKVNIRTSNYFFTSIINQRLKSQFILNQNIKNKLMKKYFLSKLHFTRN